MIHGGIRQAGERPACYELSRTVTGDHMPLDNVRLELTATCFYLLPYHHLELVKFESSRERDTISLTFVDHQVTIAGRNLRTLAVAFQERAVRAVQPMPKRYETAAGNDAYVESIEFEERKNHAENK
jgi:hypothetical protein